MKRDKDIVTNATLERLERYSKVIHPQPANCCHGSSLERYTTHTHTNGWLSLSKTTLPHIVFWGGGGWAWVVGWRMRRCMAALCTLMPHGHKVLQRRFTPLIFSLTHYSNGQRPAWPALESPLLLAIVWFYFLRDTNLEEYSSSLHCIASHCTEGSVRYSAPLCHGRLEDPYGTGWVRIWVKRIDHG